MHSTEIINIHIFMHMCVCVRVFLCVCLYRKKIYHCNSQDSMKKNINKWKKKIIIEESRQQKHIEATERKQATTKTLYHNLKAHTFTSTAFFILFLLVRFVFFLFQLFLWQNDYNTLQRLKAFLFFIAYKSLRISHFN